jgi:hypothetical protein
LNTVLKRSLAAVTVLAIALTAFEIKEKRMAAVDVTLFVSKPLLGEGGIVFVLPNRMDRVDFEAKYASQMKDAQAKGANGKGVQLKFNGTLTANVNFVHFDAPGGDYVYRFLVDPEIESNRLALREKNIGVGGNGAIYMDAVTGQPVETEVSIDHYIFGSRISEGTARGLEDYSTDFLIDDGACRRVDNLKICAADNTQLEEILKRLEKLESLSAQ